MKFSSATLFPLLVLGLLAALTFWLDRTSHGGDQFGRGKQRHDPDFWVDRFSVRRYDPTGDLQYLLTAEGMLHYPDDESTEVAAPRLTYLRNRQTRITARTAWLDKEGKHVRLNDDVRVVQPGEQGGLDTVVTTSELHIFPDDEFAYSRVPTTISKGRSVIRGSGLEMNNKTHVSVLSGPVQGTIFRSEK
jgi:lipopolysaccharide export system protein LptC